MINLEKEILKPIRKKFKQYDNQFKRYDKVLNSYGELIGSLIKMIEEVADIKNKNKTINDAIERIEQVEKIRSVTKNENVKPKIWLN